MFNPGDKVYVGVDNLNFRAGPTVSDAILDKLRLGMEVEILAKSGEPIVLTKRRNVWYKVRTKQGVEGYLFGAALSPLRVPLWEQGSDVPQVTAVTFNPEFQPRVRLWLPKEDRTFSRDVVPTSAFTGGVITAQAQAVGDSQQLMVQLCDPGSGQCATTGVRLEGKELVQTP